MALGLFDGSKSEKNVDPELTTSNDAAYEAGRQDGSRRMSRIDRPIVRPIVVPGDEEDLTETQLSVGKQMELEQDNAIKYRTCSWPKVIHRSPAVPLTPIHLSLFHCFIISHTHAP